MKRYFGRIVVLLSSLMMIFACGKSIIPEDELTQIFRDIYVANAYYHTLGVSVDSIDIYEPVLDRYGYTSDDLKSTMLEFSRRKNARLSTVIEEAIRQIEVEYNGVEGRVAVLDTIDARAQRKFQVVVLDSLRIEARAIKDTAKLRIELDVEPGYYHISYVYELDSLDKNSSLKGTHLLIDSLNKRINHKTKWYSSKKRERYEATIEVKPNARKLQLIFGNYNDKMKRPRLTIDSLKIVYQLPKDVARDSLARTLIDYALKIDDREWYRATKDSISLCISPPRISSEGRDSIQ